MTHSGLVSGYIWSKKAKKKDNLIFFLSKKHFLNFLSGSTGLFSLLMFFSNNFCLHIFTHKCKSKEVKFNVYSICIK
jgi:hypothetical protein